MMSCEFIKGYTKNDTLRKSLGSLAKKTFGIDLEGWYQSGRWEDSHIPYSFVDGESIVSNVLANKMKMSTEQKDYTFIQIGTVMTEPAYRNNGYLRKLIEQIIEDYKDEVDGFYLYANDSVTEFYPKFGFIAGDEYVYTRKIHKPKQQAKVVSLKDCSKKEREAFYTVREKTVPNEAICNKNKGLLAFWTDSLDGIYYLPEAECYVGTDVNEDTLVLKQIFSNKVMDVNLVIDSFYGKAKKVELGFVPLDEAGFEAKKIVEKDYHYFYMGEALETLEKQKVRFPEYSHA